MKRSSQSGSHILAVAVGLFVIGVLAFSGYKVWQMQQPALSSSNSANTQTASTAPATIKTTADLSQTAKYLDEASTQLNSSFDSSTFNADINSML